YHLPQRSRIILFGAAHSFRRPTPFGAAGTPFGAAHSFSAPNRCKTSNTGVFYRQINSKKTWLKFYGKKHLMSTQCIPNYFYRHQHFLARPRKFTDCMAERLHQQAKSPARTRTLLMMTSSSSKQSGNAESISGGKCSSQLKWRSVAAKSAKGSAGLGGSQKSQKEQQARTRLDQSAAASRTRLDQSAAASRDKAGSSPQSRCRSSEEQPETSQDHETVRDQLLLADFSDDELTDAEAESGELFLTPKPPVPKPRTRRTLTMEQPAAQVTQLDPALPINFNAAAPVPTPRRRRSQQQPQPVLFSSTPDFEPLPPPPTLPVPRERHSRCRPSDRLSRGRCRGRRRHGAAGVRRRGSGPALLTRSRLTQGLPAVTQPKTQAKGCSELANALTTARRPMEQPALVTPPPCFQRLRHFFQPVTALRSSGLRLLPAVTPLFQRSPPFFQAVTALLPGVSSPLPTPFFTVFAAVASGLRPCQRSRALVPASRALFQRLRPCFQRSPPFVQRSPPLFQRSPPLFQRSPPLFAAVTALVPAVSALVPTVSALCSNGLRPCSNGPPPLVPASPPLVQQRSPPLFQRRLRLVSALFQRSRAACSSGLRCSGGLPPCFPAVTHALFQRSPALVPSSPTLFSGLRPCSQRLRLVSRHTLVPTVSAFVPAVSALVPALSSSWSPLLEPSGRLEAAMAHRSAAVAARRRRLDEFVAILMMRLSQCRKRTLVASAIVVATICSDGAAVSAGSCCRCSPCCTSWLPLLAAGWLCGPASSG
uniref:DNA-directed DNA polymerase n=1 Tax=Macrostomum lignano TaxID=282301 RepID=A0A1I8FLH1_9PLAT